MKPARKRHLKKRRIAWKEVYFPDLVRGLEMPRVRGKVFESCHILGPAIVLADNCTWNHAHFHVPDIETILWEREVGDSITGVIQVTECFFNSCSFEHFAFAGATDLVDEIRGALNDG